MPAQCGIPSNANERWCNGSVRLRTQTPRLEGSDCYVDSEEVRFPQSGTIDADEKKLADGARKDGEGQQTCVAERAKKKAPGPCELRALLRDAPSSPRTRHGRRHVTWHRQTLRSDNASYCSGARPSAQPKSLARRDRNFRSLQGRVTTATPIPRYWTSCMAG